jgi:dienelactone hydrolase
VLVGLLVVALLGASCSSTSTVSASSSLAGRGPYAVGVTTLDLGPDGTLGERRATVFYPADPSRLAGHAVFSYRLGDPLPPALVAIVPRRYDSTITVRARVDAPASTSGPFPVVLFSHGLGASRLFYSQLLSGIASWGYVVVSADYLERGLLSQATRSTVPDTPALDRQAMFGSLDAAAAASGDPSSPLHGALDLDRIAAVGHSAGGQTAFDALSDPRVALAVGWAPVGPSGTAPAKPVTIIGAQQDIALTPATLTHEYDSLAGPTTFVEISGEGHNTFTDICPSIRQGGGGLVGFAISLHLISQELAQLANNGCTTANAPASRFWPIVQAYTLAALRDTFGTKTSPGAGSPSPHQFPGFTVTVRHHG